MSFVRLCSLCLSSHDLVDVFDSKLQNAEHLRFCVLLATGIRVGNDRIVNRFVCGSCTNLVSLQYEFRHRALGANRSLKIYKKIANGLEQDSLTQNSIQKMRKKSTQNLPNWNELHWSVKALFKRYKRLIIPVDVLKLNILPTLRLSKTDEQVPRVAFKHKKPMEAKQIPAKRLRVTKDQKFYKCEHCNLCFSLKLKLSQHRKRHKKCENCGKWIWASTYRQHRAKCMKITRGLKLSLVKVDDEYPMLKPFLTFNMNEKISLKKLEMSSTTIGCNFENRPPSITKLPKVRQVTVIEIVPLEEDDDQLKRLIAENGLCLSKCSIPNCSEVEYSLLNAEIRKRVTETNLEINAISKIFKKYTCLPKTVITVKNADNILACLTADGVIVRKLGLDLRQFYIPIECVISPEWNVKISFNKSTNSKEKSYICDWSPHEVQRLNNEAIKEESEDLTIDIESLCEYAESETTNIRVKAPWECTSIY